MNFDSLCIKDNVKFLVEPVKDNCAKMQAVLSEIAPIPSERGQRYRKTVKVRE